jgi:hypothetical protein
VCAAASLVLDGAAVLWARRPDRPHRPVVLGTAAGLGFGVSGLLLKQVLAVPVVSVAAAVTAVELAAVALCAFVLTQWAFSAGPLVASLPVLTVGEPALAVVLAGPLFGEWPATGPAERLGQLLGGLLLVGGLVVLARTGPSGGGDDGRPPADAGRAVTADGQGSELGRGQASAAQPGSAGDPDLPA